MAHLQQKTFESFEREPSLKNIAAHQRYLEKLQFEANTLRMWYNGLQDEIMEESQKVHLHMICA